MIRLFRKKVRTDERTGEANERWKELDERYRRLEEALDRLNARFPQVTIENVHIHQPVLEKLEFRLDGLDIEHLSGSLNLGNNFGARFGHESKRENGNDGKPNARREQAASPQQAGIHRTPTGFRFTNRR